MLGKDENDLLMQVGPGTAMGALLPVDSPRWEERP